MGGRPMDTFSLHSPYKPTGDQPQAIEALSRGIEAGDKYQTLLGVTGSGKTFTMASIIEKIQKPTLVLAHNKTLAAQLASEFRTFFPDNAVQYFVSYYDYYQPEAYVPRTDTYIAKESTINEEIDKLRHRATMSLLTRRDVLIVATVSCIYGLGTPKDYDDMKFELAKGQNIKRDEILRHFVRIQYSRNDIDFTRGTFRVRGDVVEILPTYSDDIIKIDLFGDTIDRLTITDHITGEILGSPERVVIFPATHYVTYENRIDDIIAQIERDLATRLAFFRKHNKLLEAQRLEERTRHDIEMLKATGFCSGIENYSLYLDERKPGTPPFVLLDYFPDDYLMFIDESHMTVPQVGGMSGGDASRKETLVDFGFRLPSAKDNRPLAFPEFMGKLNQVVFVSATPREFELTHSTQVVEQVVRPTGLLDPTIDVRPTDGQIDNLLEEVRARTAKGQRTLITTLTKRMAEDLSEYLKEVGVKVQYLHSDIDTLERLEILRDLRLGKYDVVVGINLLREGLDLPEVSLVAILDADKEGFLRNSTSLIQTIGRAARHDEGHVIMYADNMTDSMKQAIGETERRRKKQEAYNKKHGITPQRIMKEIKDERLAGAKAETDEGGLGFDATKVRKQDIPSLVRELTDKMEIAAQNLEFEEAALLRDQINELEKAK
jgi:excinuclease ABC subunit B